MSDTTDQNPVYQIPERVCALWCGFAAFAIAFLVRLLACGQALPALLIACASCLIACWIGRVASQYLNANLLPDSMDDASAKGANPPSTAK